GVITATVGANGKLSIACNNNNVTFSFGQDSSGALAALGINTFFTGRNASDIAVNDVLTTNPSLLAAARETGSNANALALSTAGKASVSLLGNRSILDYY